MLRNILWLFFDRMFRIFVSLFIVALVARYLAPELFGILNYAASTVALLAILSTLGMDKVVIRNMVRCPADTYVLLGTSFIMRLSGGLLIVITCAVFSFLLKPSDTLLRSLLLITASGYLFQSLNVIDLFFQAGLRSKYTVLANNIAFILTSAIKLIAIALKAPVETFAAIATLEMGLTATGLVTLYLKQSHSLTQWKFEFKTAMSLFKDSWPLIFSGAAFAINTRIDQIMIGNISGNADVGVYAVAVQLSESWYFIPVAIVASMYPGIVTLKESGNLLQYHDRLQRVFNVMTILGYAAAILGTLLAGPVVQLMFGPAYAAAANVLIAYIWCGIFIALGVARSNWLISENLTWFPMASAVSGAIINILLNLIMIRKFGLVGAAWATLITQAIVSYFATLLVSPKIFAMQTKSLFFPWRFK